MLAAAGWTQPLSAANLVGILPHPCSAQVRRSLVALGPAGGFGHVAGFFVLFGYKFLPEAEASASHASGTLR